MKDTNETTLNVNTWYITIKWQIIANCHFIKVLIFSQLICLVAIVAILSIAKITIQKEAYIYKEFARHLLLQTIMRIFAENLNGNKEKQIMIIEEIIRYNRQFVESKGYEKFLTSKYPDKKLAILSCMDTRLTELLPAALGIKNGDAKLIKNAGGLVISPFDSAMRSILVAIYELHVEEVMVIAHSNCGACHMNGREMKRAMVERGIRQDVIDTVAKCGIDLDHWLEGFHDTEDSVRNTVDVINHHPLVPADINVHGYIIDSETGLLEEVK